MTTWNVAPVFVVKDIGESIEYYTQRLGFDLKGTFGTPIEMAFVGKCGIQIMLQDSEGKSTPGPNSAYKSVAWDGLVWVDDVSSLYSGFERNGAMIKKSPYKTFYGHMEIEVLDVDGNVLCFSQAS